MDKKKSEKSTCYVALSNVAPLAIQRLFVSRNHSSYVWILLRLYRPIHVWNNFLIMRLMENCFIRKLYGFEGRKMWRVNFFGVCRGISKFPRLCSNVVAKDFWKVFSEISASCFYKIIISLEHQWNSRTLTAGYSSTNFLSNVCTHSLNHYTLISEMLLHQNHRHQIKDIWNNLSEN